MKFKFLVSLILIYSFVLLGCPTSRAAIENATAATVRLPTVTDELVLKVEEGFNQKIFSLEEKDFYIKNLRLMALGESGFRQLVEAANEIYKRDGKLSDFEFKKLFDYFDANVIKHFSAILTRFNLLSGENAQFLALVITSVRSLVRTIAQGFKPKNASINLPEITIKPKPS